MESWIHGAVTSAWNHSQNRSDKTMITTVRLGDICPGVLIDNKNDLSREVILRIMNGGAAGENLKL